ncbi:MAG: hypothetical protein R2724_26040 [Bryobacterales bacterium]
MGAFLELLRTNRNYRWMWLGQIVSEIGDHFNTIAVFSLLLDRTGSGAVVSGAIAGARHPHDPGRPDCGSRARTVWTAKS